MQTATKLVENYGIALLNQQKMSAWKRQLTRYCNQRASQTGKPATRFRGAVKCSLTKAGYCSVGL